MLSEESMNRLNGESAADPSIAPADFERSVGVYNIIAGPSTFVLVFVL
jgi:hypothetical protein